jgi:hypothetical protein
MFSMKKSIKLLSKTCIVALLSLGLFKSYHLYKRAPLSQDLFPIKNKQTEKHFTIIVSSHNPGKACEKNLHALFSQEYQNYKIYYIDNGSTDNTLSLVRQVASYHQKTDKITIISHQQNPLPCLFQVIQDCPDQEIILALDATDFLAHEQVLAKLNRVYHNPFIWMTYGNFLHYPSYKQLSLGGKEISKSIVFNNSYRSHDIGDISPISFLAGLFKQINPQDLERYSSKNAYLFPLLEMSGKHARFVCDILSLHTGSEKDPTELSLLAKQPKYQRLKNLPFSDTKHE